MRYINYFSEVPQEREMVVNGKIANIFIRRNIEAVTVDGDEPRTEYMAEEFFEQIPYHEGLEITEDLVNKIIGKDTEEEAKKVRAKRNALLAACDCEVLPDRNKSTTNAYKAWAEYREALRDLPEQSGFPFNVIWPEKPEV